MSRDTIRTVRAMTRQIRGMMRGIVRRATLGTLNVAGRLQTLQAKTLADDVDDDVELFESYGFTSGPPPGSEGLVLRVGGERGHSVGLAFGSRTTRPEGLLQGEVSVYHQGGAHVTLRNDGSIEAFPGPAQIVKLGGEGGLAVARATDPVAPSSALIAWAAVVETAVNALAPSTFTPGNSFAGTVSADFSAIAAGGQGSTST